MGAALTGEPLPTIPVTVSTARGFDGRPIHLLTYAEPCEGCGTRHQHGGGLVGEPLRLGSRIVHCPSHHRRFRDDCEHAKGDRFCGVEHLPGRAVELVVAEDPS